MNFLELLGVTPSLGTLISVVGGALGAIYTCWKMVSSTMDRLERARTNKAELAAAEASKEAVLAEARKAGTFELASMVLIMRRELDQLQRAHENDQKEHRSFRQATAELVTEVTTAIAGTPVNRRRLQIALERFRVAVGWPAAAA